MSPKRSTGKADATTEYARSVLMEHPDPPRPVQMFRYASEELRSAVAVGLYILAAISLGLAIVFLLFGDPAAGLLMLVGAVPPIGIPLLIAWLMKRNLANGLVAKATVTKVPEGASEDDQVIRIRVSVDHPRLGEFKHTLDGLPPERAARLRPGDTLEVLVPPGRKALTPPVFLE